jgi:hypothetical protein
MTAVKGLGILAAGILLIAVLWAVGVFGTIFGAHVNAFVAKKTLQPRIQQQVFNPNNAISSQAYFETLNTDYEGYLIKIKIAKQLFKSFPTTINQTNLAGVRTICITTAQRYNAAARSILSSQFITADLPTQLDAATCN